MLLLVKWADNDGIIMLMVVCTSVVNIVEFKACGILEWDPNVKRQVIRYENFVVIIRALSNFAFQHC